ncbi:hypothetical protein ABLT32_02095 [Bacteroides pyogenes]|uniref:hypothetical protein n=1 Tax=Bacteroides pyogenes TaxID=310300 RepID=UPI0040648FD5
MAKKLSQLTIGDLIPDDKNMNKGCEFGGGLIKKSLSQFGAGRSILLDKNNRIIAGNKTVEYATSAGLNDVIVVETTGDKIVAVKRTDVDLDSKYGRELALADNASAKANIVWDDVAIEDVSNDFDINIEDWGIVHVDDSVFSKGEDDGFEAPEHVVETDIKQGDLFEIKYNGLISRLQCGDSCSLADVNKLMHGEKADMIFTDPPYDLEDNYSTNIFSIAHG